MKKSHMRKRVERLEGARTKRQMQRHGFQQYLPKNHRPVPSLLNNHLPVSQQTNYSGDLESSVDSSQQKPLPRDFYPEGNFVTYHGVQFVFAESGDRHGLDRGEIMAIADQLKTECVRAKTDKEDRFPLVVHGNESYHVHITPYGAVELPDIITGDTRSGASSNIQPGRTPKLDKILGYKPPQIEYNYRPPSWLGW